MAYSIKYTIKLQDQTKKQYLIKLDEKGRMITENKASDKDWTRLENNKCPNCTLSESTSPHCPIAVNVSHLVDDFKDMLSHTQVTVVVETEERNYVKMTDLQTCLQSIFGIIMATSGCPVTGYFRQMARFHVPFASVEEHMVRSTSFHLLKQMFRFRKGEPASFDLESLQKVYEDVSEVNMHFSKRIDSATVRDSGKNAVIGLHTIGEIIGMEIGSSMEMIDILFEEDESPNSSL